MKVITKHTFNRHNYTEKHSLLIETTLANPHSPNRNLLDKEFPTLVDESTPN